MSGSYYRGDSPIESLWVLDNGGELRYFLTDESLAAAVLLKYAQSAADIYKMRPASLQNFSSRGIADCSTFIDLAVPERQPHPDAYPDAYDGWMSGAKGEWQALLDAAKKDLRSDKTLLIKRLAQYRDAVLNQTPLPPVNPWTNQVPRSKGSTP